MARSRSAGAGLLVVGLGTLAAPLDTSVNIAFPEHHEGVRAARCRTSAGW